MCGIIAYIGQREAKRRAFEGLKRLEYRGYDSAGIAWVNPDTGDIDCCKEAGRVAGLEACLGDLYDAEVAIGHTRWATHGKPLRRNSHPHSAGPVTLVHNGIIENEQELRKVLSQKQGKPVETQSETDSEVAALWIAAHYDGDPLKTLARCLPDFEGSYAFAILFADHPDQIYCARLGSPLILSRNEREAGASSDLLGIREISDTYCVMPEASIAQLERGKAVLFDYSLHQQRMEWQNIDHDGGDADKGLFRFFMEKEIHEEPDALRRCLAGRISDDLSIDLSADGIPDTLFERMDNIVIVACGTAMHAALMGKHWIERKLRIPCRVEIASEFRYNDPIIGPDTLLIAVSQSGETADTIASFKLGIEAGCPTLAIVNVRDSSLAQLADYVLYTNAGPEIAVASTKAYSVQLLAFYLLMLKAAAVRKSLAVAELCERIHELRLMPNRLEEYLAHIERDPLDFRRYCNDEHIFYLGRGADYYLAMEGALKLKEISYIHCEAYAAGEMKHGTISLIQDGTSCIAFATQAAIYGKIRSNLKELHSRGADILLICAPDFPEVSDLCRYRLDLPAMDPDLQVFFAAAQLQTLAMRVSEAKGLDVDHPRNLAKSVTVE